ncbi:hypothetical protein BDB01DRAFT_837856 [Pilobolus umbonatus]|nr:hypothetical protein BDB01DRAFT_837856 [Pilobolus umbonatus]
MAVTYHQLIYNIIPSPNPAPQSIAEVITEYHKTKGDIPPLLIGASTTLVGDYVYIFGGREHMGRLLSNTLYRLCLSTRIWEIIHPKNHPPIPRHFHTATQYGQSSIMIFGGIGVSNGDYKDEELTTLNDLVILDLDNNSWEHPLVFSPSPRYAHIAAIANDKLIIMGGQDINNKYINDAHIFHCKKKEWSHSFQSKEYRYGAHLSSVTAVTPTELTPPFAPAIDLMNEPFDEMNNHAHDVDMVVHVYTNHNTMRGTRQLHSWKFNSRDECIEIQDQSDQLITGNMAPPHLRFPSSFICGQQLILAGPHITPTGSQFQIWAFDLTTYMWTKMEAGPALAQGSWLRGVLAEKSNHFVVFGHPQRSMADDYRERAHCFEHIAIVDIEVFGVYRPPRLSFSSIGQGLGLHLWKNHIIADLNIVTTDNQTVPANSAILAKRWPSIKQLLNPILSPEKNNLEALSDHRKLLFPDSQIVLIAFLQFIYTDHLVTAEQHQPYILSRLLFLSDLFKISRLKELAIHALHQMLNMSTASMIYESASLSNAVSLQVRALRVLINAKKILQRKKQMEAAERFPPSQSLPGINQLGPPQLQRNLSNPLDNQSASSRFLQKYDLISLKSVNSSSNVFKDNTRPNTPYSNPLPNPPPLHNRSLSQQSFNSDPNVSPTRPVNGKTKKISNFLSRQSQPSYTQPPTPQHSQSHPPPQMPYSTDPFNSFDPLHSSTPVLTPSLSTSSHATKSRPHTSFWRQTNSSTHSKKKFGGLTMDNRSMKSNKSESGSKMQSSFSFLNSHS